MNSRRAVRLTALANILAHVIFAVALALLIGQMMSAVEGDASPRLVTSGAPRYAIFLIIAFLSFFLGRKSKSWLNLALVVVNSWIAAYLLFSTITLFIL